MLKLDSWTKFVVAAFLCGLLYGYRYQLFFNPILSRFVSLQNHLVMTQAHDLTITRVRLAAEDTARFIDENMQSVESFPDRYELFKHSIRAAKLDGLYCEFGVWKGESVNFIADLVPSKTVHGFDSFEGLPESWRDGFGRGAFAINGLPPVRKNVVLHKGWFDKTVPEFHAQYLQPVAFVHMDADLYSSTATVFDGMADRIVPGTVIQFDEFFNYPGWRNGEFKAFNELVAKRNLHYSFLGYSDQQAAVLITGVSQTNSSTSSAAARASSKPGSATDSPARSTTN